MEDYILFTLGLVIGFWLGKIVTNAINTISFREILKDLNVTEQQLRDLRRDLDDPDSESPAAAVIEVKLEQHGDTIYAYRKDNDQFLGQGPDREALIERLRQNLTNARVVIAKEDGADLIRNG